jgi:hypothetical protein
MDRLIRNEPPRTTAPLGGRAPGVVLACAPAPPGTATGRSGRAAARRQRVHLSGPREAGILAVPALRGKSPVAIPAIHAAARKGDTPGRRRSAEPGPRCFRFAGCTSRPQTPRRCAARPPPSCFGASRATGRARKAARSDPARCRETIRQARGLPALFPIPGRAFAGSRRSQPDRTGGAAPICSGVRDAVEFGHISTNA